MTWGPAFMHYHCPDCGKKFKYETALIGELQSRFGCCPVCGREGVFDFDGARTKEGEAYEEVD